MNALLAALALLSGPAPLLYPLDHTPRITSTFGTYRIGHHHAGLDLFTEDDESVAVRASADGEVVRIYRSSSGYGRVFYIRHDDGRITVYAHLSAFAPRFQPFVDAAAAKAGVYRFKKVFRRADRPKVKRGEVLGFVGTSGTDLVHLHYEVRDGLPVNPLTNGLEVPDTQPPHIARLMAVPRTAKAQVEGAHDDKTWSFDDKAHLDEVVVTGDVGLLVEVNDHIEGSSRDLSPYEISLYIDGRLWHRTRYETVSYGDKGQPELDFHPRLRAHREGLFNKLYGEGPRVRTHRKVGKRLKRLRRGVHPARVEAKDAAGNVSEARFDLRVVKAAAPCKARWGKVRAKKAPLPVPVVWREDMVIVPIPGACEDGLRLEVRLDGKRTNRAARLTQFNGQPAVAIDLDPTKDTNVEVRVAHGKTRGARYRFKAYGVREGEEITPGPLKIEPTKDALFFPYVTGLTEVKNPGGPGLDPLTPLYRMGNPWRPTRRYSKISLARPKGLTGPEVGLYLHDNGKWWRLGSKGKTRVFGATVHLVDFALMRDAAAPVIDAPHFEAHPGGPRLVVPVKDAGSGVSSVVVQVDGVETPFERQRAYDQVVWLVGDGLTPGEHRIDVVAKDRAGHITRRSGEVVWPPVFNAPKAETTGD